MPRPRLNPAAPPMTATERKRLSRERQALRAVEIGAAAQAALARVRERDGDASDRATVERLLLRAAKR